MPIDYSKWDKLDDYSSSDDEGQNDAIGAGNTPQVTTLNGPSRVSFGGANGSSVVVEPSTLAASTKVDEKVDNASMTTTSPIPATAAKPPTTTEAPPTPAPISWTNRGGCLVTNNTNSADKPRRLVWSQDRYSVQIRLELFPNEKVSQVFLQNVSSYQDRHCATGGGTTPRLQITCRSEKSESKPITILNEELPHPIHWAQEDDDGVSEGNTDWTVEVDPEQTRFVLVSLYKAVPMQGIFIWWKRPLLCFPETESATEPTAAQSSFLKAWEEAHDIFRQSKRDKHSI